MLLEHRRRIDDLFENYTAHVTDIGGLRRWTTKREDGVHWITILESDVVVVMYGCDSSDPVSDRADAFICKPSELHLRLKELGL